MKILNLNGMWKLKYRAQSQPGGNWNEIEATVPGNVELELMREGVISDLCKGDNIYQALELERNEWLYVKDFYVPDNFPMGKAVLVFEGIDCIASIKLNGHEIGRAANMFVSHCFDTGEALDRNGKNLLEVHITSAVIEGMSHELSPDTYAQPTNWESLRIRKAPHMYGWDIAPRIFSAGLWRGVRLEAEDSNRFRGVYLGTAEADVTRRKAKLLLDWDITTTKIVHTLHISVTIDKAGAVVHSSKIPCLGVHGQSLIDLADVDFWWPRGYGEPHLYNVTLMLVDDAGKVLAEHHEKIGIRTVRLRRSETTSDSKNGDFAFLVNGQRIFMKGTNWVPLDALHSLDSQHLEKTFAMAVDLNCNMLRCWGGNVYEDHDFFNLCDMHGILVWQDFALACACYPQDEEFAGQVRNEAESVVKKLRNHPSLCIWSGNNEIDNSCAECALLKRDPNVFDKISRIVLAEVVAKLDPLRDYLPSSPYYGPELMAKGLPHNMKPEDHLWGPRDDFKGKFYMSSNAHFVSEIGYHGCPDAESMREMFDTDKLWPWQNNDQWLTKAVRALPAQTSCDYRIPLMANQIAVLFDKSPESLEDFILASQISQAEALKFFIEKWRSEKEFRSGILWWNLRDCWPILSDAIVDYYYRRKLAYSYVKVAQTNVCAIVTEPENSRHKLVVVNDTLLPASGRVTLRNADSDFTLYEGGFRVGSNGKTVVAEVAAVDKAALWLIYTDIDGSDLSHKSHYIAGSRPFNIETYKKWLKLIKR